MKRGTQTATFMASAMALAASGMERDRARLAPRPKKQRDPIAPTSVDERNVRQVDAALTLSRQKEITPEWLAYHLRAANRTALAEGFLLFRNPGTPSSWRKRLRRLAALGWVKQGKDGTWSLTAAGKKEAAR